MKNRVITLRLFVVGMMMWGSLQLMAQDTLHVQTFTWDSQTRSDVFEFPEDNGQSYAKILMTYNMHCHDNAVGSGAVGCREWDYSCNTFITDSTRMDSAIRFHPTHLISNFREDVFPYTETPVYTYRQFERITTSGGPATDLDTVDIYQDDTEVAGWQNDQIRYQFIMTAQDLTDAGISAGMVQGLELPFQIGDFMSMSFRVKIGHTQAMTLDPAQPVLGNLEEVYFNQLEINSPGMNQLIFHEGFDWDGTSNVIVELSYNDKMTPTPEKLKGASQTQRAIIANDEDHAFTLNGGQYVPVASTDIDQVSDQITVMGWFYGFPDNLPANTYAMEGVDEDNNRQFNLHLPWSDGSIYFDCGNDGSGYDRINKQASAAEMAGQWNHWAFTKNATTGQMKIYHNGNLWHSGNGKTKPISLENMNIGKGINSNNGYFGWLNEISIWKSELTQSEIASTMRFSIDNSHPSYDDLLVYLPFEEAMGDRVRNAQNNQYYNIQGVGHWQRLRGEEFYLNFESTDAVPAVSLLQGDVERMTTVNTYRDSMVAPQHYVRPFDVVNSRLVENASKTYWRAGDYFVKNKDGDIVDTVTFASEGEVNIGELDYFIFSPAKYEILSLVTPYGNGLSLGDEGKTFTFDVTDFAPLLKGKKKLSVEMGGQWKEELDVAFHFIEGTPVREVLDIQNIWRFDRGNYGAIQAERAFEPRKLTLNKDASEYKIRSSITGHGQNGEFQPRNHYMNVNNGAQNIDMRVWKECSTIPIYPQGGTWIFDRAGWCPGDPTLLFETDLKDVNPGSTIDIDYGVVGPHMDQANYLVSHQLVSYGAKRFANNATLLDIVRPSTKVEWERENPSCNKPTIVIQNNGTEMLKFAMIEYGLKGGVKEMFNWAGNLDFGQSEEVELPIRMENFWAEAVNGNTKTFVAKIVEVNRTTDENEADNILTSEVKSPLVSKWEGIQLSFTTNNRGSETSFEITNSKGEVVYSGDGYGANQKVDIDLDLSPGCYSLNFEDSGDDGLYYWLWERDPSTSRGRGNVRLNRLFRDRYVTFKNFEAEFGRYIHYDFVVDGLVGINEQKVLRHLDVYPNPNSGQLTIDFYSEKSAALQVDVYSPAGQLIFSRELQAGVDQNLKEELVVPGAQSGMHMVRFTQEDRTVVKRVMVHR